MKFLDEAKINCISGAGGNGCVSFRRERNLPFGGPDGGNGGKGSSIIFVGDRGLNTLIDFRYQQHYKGKRGGNGMGRNRTGGDAADVLVRVPCGTEIIDETTDEVLVDILEHGQRFVLLEGGKGGRGNLSFTSSTNRAPRQFTEGEEAQEMDVRLRLKLLADVGLLGLPSAGKSTFVSSVSNAKPKIADYPFTTLAPALGMVRHHQTDMVIADLPGLIKGASEGSGLGHRFLKHTSRCAVLLHLVDPTPFQTVTPAEAYTTLRGELAAFDDMFGTSIASLPEVVAISKADTLSEDDIAAARKALKKVLPKGQQVLVVSAHSRLGVETVLEALAATVKEKRMADFAAEDAAALAEKQAKPAEENTPVDTDDMCSLGS